MANKYSFDEAVKKLEINEAELKKIVGQGEVIADHNQEKMFVNIDEVLNLKDLLGRLEKRENKEVPYSIIDDKEFINFLYELFEIKTRQILKQMLNQSSIIRKSTRSSQKKLEQNVNDIKNNVEKILKLDFEEDASSRIQLFMQKSVENIITEMSLNNEIKSSEVSQADREKFSGFVISSIDKLLEDKLSKLKSIDDQLQKLQTNIKSREDLILEKFNQLRTDNPVLELEKKIDTFVSFCSENIDGFKESLQNRKQDLQELSKNLDNAKSELATDNPDIRIVVGAVNELKEGQLKIRRILASIGNNIHREVIGEFTKIKKMSQEFPGLVDEVREMLPTFQDILEERLANLSQATRPLVEPNAAFSQREKQEFLGRLVTIENSLRKAGKSENQNLDPKFTELRRAIENALIKVAGRQQKNIIDKLQDARILPESINSIKNSIKDMESIFDNFYNIFEERFANLEKAVGVAPPRNLPNSKNPPGIEKEEMDQRIIQIQSLLDDFSERLEAESINTTFEEIVQANFNKLKESQESYQKFMVNMNVNNQNVLVEKLQQLDRLNELINIEDSIDEITEQMQTFEAIMADVNQLVDERLQSLEHLNSNLSSFKSLGKGGHSEDMNANMDELNSVILNLRESFAPEQILKNIKYIIYEQTNELKESQESVQKILVNLNVNSQKWLMEKLDSLESGFENIKDIEKQFNFFENLIPSISDLIDVKLKKLNKIQAETSQFGIDTDLVNSLARLQKLLEHESKILQNDIDSSQKMIVNLVANNQKILLEKMDGLGFTSESVDKLVHKNREVLTSIIGYFDPEKNLAYTLENMEQMLATVKENIILNGNLGKLSEVIKDHIERTEEESSQFTENLTLLSSQIKQEVITKVDKLFGAISDIRKSVDPETIISSMGDFIIEGNEILKENQQALVDYQIKTHKELNERLDELEENITGHGSSEPGKSRIIPVMESLLENQLASFKTDLDGAHKVLVNLNVNLQKQLLARIREIIENTPGNGGSQGYAEFAKKVGSLLNERFEELQEGQKELYQANLQTQEVLEAKFASLANTGKILAGEDSEEARALIPVLEKILNNKLDELWVSYEKARESLERISTENHEKILEKLDSMSGIIAETDGQPIAGEQFPEIRKTLEETNDFILEFRKQMEVIRNNFKAQGVNTEDIGETSGVNIDYTNLESIISQKLNNHQDILEKFQEKLDKIQNTFAEMFDDDEIMEVKKIHELFTSKLEETRDLENRLLETMKQMQDISRKIETEETSSGNESSAFTKIDEELEDTKKQQEKILEKVNGIFSMIETIPFKGTGIAGQAGDNRELIDKLKNENKKLLTMIGNLQKENEKLYKQFSEGEKISGPITNERFRVMMEEKDKHLDACYKEKLELRDQFEMEKRDKYELIQRYETEKKELIDSLALERIQREKERSELELLREEMKKKKWWQ